jgi:hypothetical protein
MRQQIGFWFTAKFHTPDDLKLHINSGYTFFKKRYLLNKILIAAKQHNALTAEWIVGGDMKSVVLYVRHLKELNVEKKFVKFTHKRLGHSLF